MTARQARQPGQPGQPGQPAHKGAVQVDGEVFSVKRVGDYIHLTVVAGEIAERTRPGSFVAVSVGGDTSAALLRRPMWLYRVRPSGVYGGTVELVVAVRGAGTSWLAQRQPHDPVNLMGPLGRPFALPQEPVSCALVGSGYGAAPLFMLAERLRERHCTAHMVVGAETEGGLFGALEAKRAAQSVTVTTVDGSVGIKGWVTDPLPALITRQGIDVVYACGPRGMLEQVSAVAATNGAWSQTAVEVPMACCVGVCGSCVVPVVGEGATTKMLRACVEGPVFRGDKVAWPGSGPATVPADGPRGGVGT